MPTFIGHLIQDYNPWTASLDEETQMAPGRLYEVHPLGRSGESSGPGAGILAFISNNHGIWTEPYIRRMRELLLNGFKEIYILDLHGTAKRREMPGWSKDENVFDIQQGVAVAFSSKIKARRPATVYHAELWGNRQAKYQGSLRPIWKRLNGLK